MKINKLLESKSVREDTSYEWKPNTSFKHIKDIYSKVKANDYKYVNNEQEEFMAAVKKADNKGYKPEECRQIKEWHRDIWQHNRKTESWTDEHQDIMARKTSGYDKCYKIVKKARTSNPVDTNALNDARDHFGYDLYKMCLDDVLKELNESKSIKESWKKGERVVLPNGQTGMVGKDFDWENEDQVQVVIDGTDEIKYVLSDVLKELRESSSIKTFGAKGKKLNEDSYGFKSGDRYYGGLPSEGSDTEYAALISNAASAEEKLLAKYGVKKEHRTTSFTDGEDKYTGSINGHNFEYIEGSSFPSKHWVSKLVIDNKEVDKYKSRRRPGDWARISDSFNINDLIDRLSNDTLDDMIFKKSPSEVKKTLPLYSFTRSVTYSGYFKPSDILRRLEKIRGDKYDVEIKTRLLSGGPSSPCIEEKYIGPKDELVAFMRAYGLGPKFDKDLKLEQPANESLSESSNPAELTDCPECGDISFDSKKGKCTKCYYREELSEALNDYRFEVSCNDQPTKIIRTVAENEDKAIKYVKNMYAQEHTTYADDRENKWNIRNLDESLSESIDVNIIADYITDHYDFDDIDDKYACINSIRDSHKDTISEEELEQFIGAHNGKDKVNESIEKGTSITLWWKDDEWSKDAPSYASCEYVGKTRDGKHKFVSTTYGHTFIVDFNTNTITTPQGKTFDLDTSSGWTKKFNESLSKDKELNEASEGFQKEFYNGYVILKNRAGDGWDIYSYDGTPEKVKKAYLEDEGYATLKDAKAEIDRLNKESNSMNEGHQVQTYKGYELDWNEDGIDPEEGTANFEVYVRKNGKELTNEMGSVLTFHGFRQAREYIDNLPMSPEEMREKNIELLVNLRDRLNKYFNSEPDLKDNYEASLYYQNNTAEFTIVYWDSHTRNTDLLLVVYHLDTGEWELSFKDWDDSQEGLVDYSDSGKGYNELIDTIDKYSLSVFVVFGFDIHSLKTEADIDKYSKSHASKTEEYFSDDENLSEASYGGAFDIADDQYFTREDLDSFAEEVLNHINETFKTQFDIASCYIDDGVLEVGVTNDEYGDYIHSEKIDMRKIKEPWHLKRAYAFEFASQLINDITQSNDGLVESVVSSSYEFDDDTDELTYYYDDEELKDALTDVWEEISSKQVPDSDGFMTDYTMYRNINTGEYVFVFGDKDIYRPEDGYFDWECETKEEAEEWFDNYHGFDESDDDIDWLGEAMEQSPIVHKKNDGSYLVAASSGDGYTAYNKNDVCVGHITAANENEAKSKFNSNQFDE